MAGRIDCCGAGNLGSLRLFNGSYTAVGVFTNVIASTVINVNDRQIPFDATVPCTPNQKYELCEIDQIFIKEATKFTYTSLTQGQCATGCTTVQCTPSYPKKPY
jgi:hypothetical protein